MKIPNTLITMLLLFFAVHVFSEETVLAVLYFENTKNKTEDAWLSKGLADMLITDLAGCEELVLVEREELEKIIKEQALALSGLVDQDSAPEIGSILGAGILITGSFFSDSQTLRIDVRAVDSENGTIIFGVQASGQIDSVLALEKKIATDIAAGLGISLKDNGVYSESAGALKEYYQGINLADDENYTEAIVHFKNAVNKDPAFLKPAMGIEDAYRFLKDFKNRRYQREINTLLADIKDLSKRITADVFFSFADAVADPHKFGFTTVQDVSDYYQSRPNVLNGDTPVQATWHLQHLFYELSHTALEYFQDEDLSAWCGDQILLWTKRSKDMYPDDSFLSEVVYMPLLVYSDREEYGLLINKCENFMLEYPDHRMIWAVEDMYEYALNEITENEEN